MKIYLPLFILLFAVQNAFAQAVPATEENIPYLVTFGSQGEKSWGDDDFSQVFFFVIPKTHSSPVYIRVYDPGIGGSIDEQKGFWNTKTRFQVYGGKGCVSTEDAKGSNPVGNYKSGNLLSTKLFGNGYDKKWFTFGPFNPTSGELAPEFGGYVFKIIAEGVSGDDGNLYSYFLSTSADKNVEIEGGNSFTFEYTFRMHDDPKEISHVYPYIDENVVSVKQGNFDWDNDGELKIITNTRYAVHLDKSGDGNWKKSEHKVLSKEKESSFDVQFHKNKSTPVKNNNVTFFITNQFEEAIPFYTIPIGGIPKPSSSINISPK